MINHPNRNRKQTILFYDGDRAYIAYPGGSQIQTLRLHPGRYVRIDDGRQYPQLSYGAGRRGPTIEADTREDHIAVSLARDCEAKLYKTRAGYDRALAALSRY
jgi:hypothetical protein